jgi:uncharacterized membrane protein
MGEPGDNENSNWKLGLFYYNPGDKRIFVPKRYGIGWTLNFGNIISFVIMGLFLGVVIWFVLFEKGAGKH